MPISRAGAKSHHAGVTLLEVLASIVLLAVISTVTVPRFNEVYENTILKATVRELAGNLRFARASAISLNRAHALSLDLQNKYFTYEGGARKKFPRNISLTTLPVTDKKPQHKARITFFPHGGSSGADLLLQNEKRGFLVMVSPVTGRVSVKSDVPR